MTRIGFGFGAVRRRRCGPIPQPIVVDHVVDSDAAWDAVFGLGAGALSGKTIGIDGSAFSPRGFGNFAPTSPIRITSLRPTARARLPKLDIASSSNLIIDGLDFAFDNRAGADFAPNDANYLLVLNGGADLTVSDCTFDGNSGGSATPAKRKRRGGIRASGIANLTVQDAQMRYLRDGIVANGNNVMGARNTLRRISFDHIFEDGFTGLCADWDVADLVATMFEGDSGKRFAHSGITGAIAIGDVLVSGAGQATKLIEVVAIDNGYVDGYYNNFAKPSAGETYVGPSGSITLADGGSTAFDGIHGDFGQPLINTATRAYSITMRRCMAYLSAPLDPMVRGGQQLMQGLLAQTNGNGNGWSDVTVEGNVLAACLPIAVTVEGAKTATIGYNTVVEPALNSGRPDITVINSGSVGGVKCRFNVGNNGAAAVIQDGGGNMGLSTYGDVVMTAAQQDDMLVAPTSYPQTMAGLAPEAAGAVQMSAWGPAGALTPAGVFRPAFPAPPDLAIVETAASTAIGTSSATMAFAAGAGSNRRVLVSVVFASGAAGCACTWGGVAMTLVALRTTSGSNLEGIAVFELVEANFPAGGSGSIVATPTGTVTFTSLAAITLTGSANASVAPVTSASTNLSTTRLEGTIVPAAASSLVLGFVVQSNNASNSSFDLGLTRFGNALASTKTLAIGRTVQGASAIQCRNSISANVRGAMILLAFAP